MGSSNLSMSMLALTTVVVVLGMTSLFGEADDTPSCAQNLVPCGDYLKNTNPPDATCCTAIKETVASQLPCLCNLYYTPGILEALGGNTTSALRIAKDCGESLDVAKCKAFIGASSPNSAPAAPVPGSDHGNGSGRIEWTGFSALVLFWASIMFY